MDNKVFSTTCRKRRGEEFPKTVIGEKNRERGIKENTFYSVTERGEKKKGGPVGQSMVSSKRFLFSREKKKRNHLRKGGKKRKVFFFRLSEKKEALITERKLPFPEGGSRRNRGNSSHTLAGR